MNEGKEAFERGLFLLGVAILAFCAGFIVAMIKYQKPATTPVENVSVIDSLTTVNDSIKIKVEKLDSIKNAKVIEVSTLDNDSTLKLFHELVSE